MSAEKEIVNYWYNKKGFFTISNIKSSNNKDCGILALSFNENSGEVFHIDVSCSITNNITETANLSKSIKSIVDEKFNDSKVIHTLKNQVRNFNANPEFRKVVVLGAIPKSRKNEIISEFKQHDVSVIGFDNIIFDVLENLDTQYYKNDIIRTLQLTKFLLLSDPSKLSKFLVKSSNSASRKEFLSNILDDGQIIKEFKKTNTQRLGAILKGSKFKPNELAEILQHDILNKKTRKVFMNSLIEQDSKLQGINKAKRIRKTNTLLQKFFD